MPAWSASLAALTRYESVVQHEARAKGKGYVMQDGDVVEFRFNT